MRQFLWCAFLLPSLTWASERVRHITVNIDQIIQVRTAIGIATIIQVPDRPNSIVVGDQEKFKVEYLDQAITIKPLQAGAKSNLYVYTDYQRFNVQLITGAEPSADYVVYLENQKDKPQSSPSMRWKTWIRSVKNDALKFETKRLGISRDGVLLVEFQLSSLKKVQFKPEYLWLTQEGGTRPIQNLFLASLEINPGEPIQGVIQILKKDIDETIPLRIELRMQKTISLSLPKVNTWR